VVYNGEKITRWSNLFNDYPRKWVFGEEWSHLAKESHIFNFTQFNEAMGTLSNDDNETIEDLTLYFSGSQMRF
jgi:hypothetical protein